MAGGVSRARRRGRGEGAGGWVGERGWSRRSRRAERPEKRYRARLPAPRPLLPNATFNALQPPYPPPTPPPPHLVPDGPEHLLGRLKLLQGRILGLLQETLGTGAGGGGVGGGKVLRGLVG